MGLNQYLDRMNTKTSFILILGCVGVDFGVEANRKFAMENVHFHANRRSSRVGALVFSKLTTLWTTTT